MPNFGPIPPDITLAFARLEAQHFGLPLDHRLGQFVLEASSQPAVLEAMEAYQPPPVVPSERFKDTCFALSQLAIDKTLPEIGESFTVHSKTVGRQLHKLYDFCDTSNEGDTTRRLIEQDTFNWAKPFPSIKPESLAPSKHLLGIVMSRGWTLKHLFDRTGVADWRTQRISLSRLSGSSSAAGIVAGLFANRLLVPDIDLYATWKQTQATASLLT
jgi:hypothetical protein